MIIDKPHYAFLIDGEIGHARVSFPFIKGFLTEKQKIKALHHYCEHHGIQHCGVMMVSYNGDKEAFVDRGLFKDE